MLRSANISIDYGFKLEEEGRGLPLEKICGRIRYRPPLQPAASLNLETPPERNWLFQILKILLNARLSPTQGTLSGSILLTDLVGMITHQLRRIWYRDGPKISQFCIR